MAGPNAPPGLSGTSAEQTSRSLLIAHVRSHIRAQLNAVLVVDDDTTTRRVIARLILRSCPAVEVLEAINGEDALRKILERRKNNDPDPLFIITDLHMPVMDGWAFVEELGRDYHAKGLGQGIPVIVLSASSGAKGLFLGRKSIQSLAKEYSPLVSVAKEACTDPRRYDAVGEHGLATWIEYFLR